MNISRYFTWKDALYLPQYSRIADVSDGVTDEVRANLIQLFSKMDLIREFIGVYCIVHVAFRSKEYNKLVGGSPASAHMEGRACDFHFSRKSCDDVRKAILDAGKLEELGLRMEDNPGSGWVHLDTKPPIHSRFFKP